MSMVRVWFLGLLGSCLAVHADSQPATRSSVEAIDISSRLELMVDDYLVDSMDNVSFQFHSPQRAEKVLVKDSPWEGEAMNHVTVFKDGEMYRMYYRGYVKPPGLSYEKDQVFCYAESRDGIHWIKPSLGLFEWKGSKANNIVWRGGQIAPFIDTRPGVPPDQQYKSLAENPGIALVSPDAIRWKKLVDQPILPNRNWGMATLNSQKNVYMAYLRAKRNKCRSMAYSQSEDFIHWSDPVLVDFGDSPVEDLYWNMVLPYFRAPHLYLGFPMRLVYHKGQKLDCTDAVFVFSRDGQHFSRRYMEAFLRPGLDARNWNTHCNMMAWGILPTGEEEMSMYYTDNANLPTVHIRRLVLRTDGFSSLRVPYAGGEFTTRPIRFSGNRLVFNVSTGAAGSVCVEIQDGTGKPLDGYRLVDCREFFGDKIAHIVSWSKGEDVSTLAGKVVRLRVRMSDGDLYSLRFQP